MKVHKPQGSGGGGSVGVEWGGGGALGKISIQFIFKKLIRLFKSDISMPSPFVLLLEQEFSLHLTGVFTDLLHSSKVSNVH